MGLSGFQSGKYAFFGFSREDNEALARYNQLIEENVDWTQAITEALSGSSDAAKRAALAAQGETVALKSEGAAAKFAEGATKLFYGALSMLGNVALSLALNWLIESIRDYTNATENARKANEEAASKAKGVVEEIKKENNSFNSLINKYEQFQNITNYTAEQRETLLQLQDDIIEKIGDEASEIDLLNKSYQENIKIIKEQRAEKAKDDYKSYKESRSQAKAILDDTDMYMLSSEALVKGTQYEDSLNPSEFDKFISYLNGEDMTSDSSLMIKNLDNLFSELEKIGFSIGNDYETGTKYAYIPAERMDKMAQILSNAYPIIDDYYEKYDVERSSDDGLANLKNDLDKFNEKVKGYIETTEDMAENIIYQFSEDIEGQSYSFDNVTPKIYQQWANDLIEEYAKDDDDLRNAILKKLNRIYSGEDWKAALEGEDWYATWLYNQTKDDKQITESIATFNSQFDEVINNLRDKHEEYVSALEKLSADENADLTEFFQKNLDLAQFANDPKTLKDEILKANTKAIDELVEQLESYRDKLPNDEDKKKVDSFISTLDNWKYTDSISDAVNQTIEDFESLRDTLDKLESDEYTASDLNSLFSEYPELSAYAGDIDKLKEKTQELAKTKAKDMLLFLNTLKSTATDSKVISGLNSAITSIERLNFTAEEAQATAEDWLEYETNKIDEVIKKLENENDTLQDQLDIVEDMISGYETAASTVQDYIDDQVKALEDEKQAIEDDYNAQIQAIQDKNKEREQEINLQEKLDALLNAKKKRVNVYSETNGWKIQRNSSAITEAQREYDQAVDDKTIADLEKKRDKETSVFDERIKSWNDYAEQWSQKIDAVKKVADEKKTTDILGLNWREAINQRDSSILNNLATNYDNYLNREKVQLETEIADNQSRIDMYNNLKTEMQDAFDKTTEKQNAYLESLEKIAPAELTSYTDRENYLRNFLKVQDKLLNESDYGKLLLGIGGETVDDASINGAKVTYDNGKLLYDSMMNDKRTPKEIGDQMIREASYDAINKRNAKTSRYTSNKNFTFQFSGDIITNSGTALLTQVKKQIEQEKLEAMIGK